MKKIIATCVWHECLNKVKNRFIIGLYNDDNDMLNDDDDDIFYYIKDDDNIIGDQGEFWITEYSEVEDEQ